MEVRIVAPLEAKLIDIEYAAVMRLLNLGAKPKDFIRAAYVLDCTPQRVKAIIAKYTLGRLGAAGPNKVGSASSSSPGGQRK